jgi:UDP-glucuronate 4-epimerase
MKLLVTGAAGFIGSHLCEKLLQDKCNKIVGLDAFVGSGTPEWIKRRNLQNMMNHPRFIFINANLLDVSWERVLPETDIVFHLAAIPGVRSSFGDEFASYVDNNILATQRLLEACRRFPVQKLIYGSTSSVYGEKAGMVKESASTLPLSPYGVSKLTGENLCRLYHLSDGVPVVILRFFTVYGPRQRPDMAFHRFIRNILTGKPIPVNGNGLQTRDFTYVADCVQAIAAAAQADGVIGETVNVGGKERASVLEGIKIIENILGKKAELSFSGSTRGEPFSTWADIGKAEQLLGYNPKVTLEQGLAAEVLDLCELYQLPKPNSVYGSGLM